jgi:hypothetical protein
MSLVLNVEILGEFRNLTKATKGAETQLGKLNKSTEKIGKSMRNTLAAIGVGFSVTAITRGIQDTLESASDLEQQFGALDSIFKEISPTMQQFAYSLAPIGLSAADASRSMALLGSQLKGYGLPVDEAAKKTQELTLLAADLAATFGGTTYGAVESISALFRGEYDPIEKYGVAIKKSDVNARLAAEGLGDLEGEALKLAEAQTALTILFEKTTDAQGQAKRESESYAAQQAYLKAETENLKAEIGEALLPVMVELFKEIRDNLPQIKEFIRQLITLIPIIVDLAIQALEFKEAILAMTIAIGGLRVATMLLSGAAGLAGLKTAMLAVFSNPAALAFAASIGLIVLALTTLTKEANAARDAVRALEREKSKATSTGGYSLAPGDDSYAPYEYVTPPTKSEGIAGQPVSVPKAPTKVPASQVPSPININNNINVKKTTSSAQQIANAVNKASKSAGTEIIRRVGTRGTAI